MAENIVNSTALTSRAVTSAMANRHQVQAQNEQFKLQTAQTRAQNDPEVIKAQVATVKAENEELLAKISKRAAFDAFKMYSETGSVKHLKNLIKEFPNLKDVFNPGTGELASIEPINLENDKSILAQAGIKIPSTQELTRNPHVDPAPKGPNDFNPFSHLKIIKADGNAELLNMRTLFAGTGYLKQVRDEELDFLIRQKELFGTASKDNFAPGGLQKDAEFVSNTLGQPIEAVTNSLFKDKIGGNVLGQQDEVDTAIVNMEETFGGQENYFNTDFSLLDNRVKAEPFIRRIERIGGVNFNSKDRTDIKELNSLVSLADIGAEKLTPKVTGVFDSTFRGVKNYLFEEVDEVDAVRAQSAYSAFRNTIRHALFGSALTATEVQSFKEAFGTIKQKYPAVVTQFQTALEQVKSKLSTIAQLNNPYLSHYYMGKSAGEVDEIITRLDERLELFSGVTPPIKNTTNDDSSKSPDQQLNESFETIFGPKPGT